MTTSKGRSGNGMELLTDVKNWRQILPRNSSKVSAKRRKCFHRDICGLQLLCLGQTTNLAQNADCVHMRVRNVHFVNDKFGCISKSYYFCKLKFHNNLYYMYFELPIILNLFKHRFYDNLKSF